MLAPYHDRILVYRRRPLSPEQEAFYGVTWTPLDELLRESDVVASFSARCSGIEGLMGASQFGLMKRTAYFVNCGRARHVDEAALVDALRQDRIAGAGLDVFPSSRCRARARCENVPTRSSPRIALAGLPLRIDTFERLRRNLDLVQAARGRGRP